MLIKTIIGEARSFYAGYDEETECGIICSCGKCVYIKKDERMPITRIQCPECGHQTDLIYGTSKKEK